MLAFTLPISFLPGPNNLLSAAHSSNHGIQKTWPLVLGMVLGWFLLGVVVGFGALFIEENENLLNLLTYVGVGYVIYLSYEIATSNAYDIDRNEEKLLGFYTGIILQVVNGKAFLHLLVLMTTFGTVFGSGIFGKMCVALFNVGVKLIGWIVWMYFGNGLKQTFDSPKSGIIINRVMGLSLFCVAIWIAARVTL